MSAGEAGALETALEARLRELGRQADLHAERRVDVKVDLSAAAVARRLRRQSALRDLCRRIAAVGPRPPSGPG